MTWMSFLTEFGQQSLAYFWLPLGLWTLAAIPIYALSRYLGRRHPLIHYQGLLALVLALPIGLVLMPVANQFAPEAQIPLIRDWIDVSARPAELSEYGVSGEVIPDEPVGDNLLSDAGASQMLALTNGAQEKPAQIQSQTLIQSQAPISSGFTWLGGITLVAFIISLLMLLQLGINLTRLRWLRSCLIPTTDHLKLVHELARRLQIRRPILLAYCPGGISPMTFGWLQPVIAIPESLKEDPQALKTTLLHELIHIQRNDFFWGLISQFITAALIYHPGIWWISKELNLYRELSCDTDTLANQSYSPADYARLLLHFNSAPSVQDNPAIAISMVRKQSSLKRRIEHMTRSFTQYPTAIRIAFVFAFLLLPALMVACSSTPTNVDTQETITLADKQRALIKLEAEVNYLRTETLALKAQLDTLSFERRQSEDELHRAAIQREYEYQLTRSKILEGMLWRKVEALEETRVDMIAEGVLAEK